MSGSIPRARIAVAAVATLALSACGLTPLSHRINAGEEPFVVFVGTGLDGHTDLFAVKAGGGTVTQFTFTPQVEMDPRLAPDGRMVAFLRARDTLSHSPRQVIVMNLITGDEVTPALPARAGQPREVGWTPDGVAVYVHTDSGYWRAPPAAHAEFSRLLGPDSARAVAALQVWLGHPPFARVIPCATGGLCVLTTAGDTGALAPAGGDPIRWGNDSVAWFEGGELYVRPFGPGVRRRVAWQNAPKDPRDGTYSPGT